MSASHTSDANVSPRVACCLFGELTQVCVTQAVGQDAQVQPEHLGPCGLLWVRDVDTLLKPDSDMMY